MACLKFVFLLQRNISDHIKTDLKYCDVRLKGDDNDDDNGYDYNEDGDDGDDDDNTEDANDDDDAAVDAAADHTDEDF